MSLINFTVNSIGKDIHQFYEFSLKIHEVLEFHIDFIKYS